MDLQWLQSDEAKKISEDAKAKAWKDFKTEYPFADLSKFEAQTDFNKKHATADVFLKRVLVFGKAFQDQTENIGPMK